MFQPGFVGCKLKTVQVFVRLVKHCYSQERKTARSAQRIKTNGLLSTQSSVASTLNMADEEGFLSLLIANERVGRALDVLCDPFQRNKWVWRSPFLASSCWQEAAAARAHSSSSSSTAAVTAAAAVAVSAR